MVGWAVRFGAAVHFKLWLGSIIYFILCVGRRGGEAMLYWYIQSGWAVQSCIWGLMSFFFFLFLAVCWVVGYVVSIQLG